jgi:carbamoyl-phosphate synthase large subunit
MSLPTKVLLLGSGGLKIGQAGEFDYSGSQALKALRWAGIRSVLINPNIATIQTSAGMADATYFLPVTPEYVRKVIARERPDGILLSFGGQTALNCGVALDRDGTLAEYGVAVLGTPVASIEATEDRDIFARRLAALGVKTPRSVAVVDTGTAVQAAAGLGYPVMVRAAYAMGGSGSGLCVDVAELRERCARAFAVSPQVLVEEWLGGWKEIEYEVVRDRFDNCITVCNMENFDPLGIHTGESIVVAPSQTLSDHEYQLLRRIALLVIRDLGIIGECNIQYALDPASDDYRVIEVNARLSRSSALASKATGYPLAAVAARLALGESLVAVRNSVTQVTTACFEPAMDYCVVKAPRWDLGKFKEVDRRIGSEMKSVGEVMAIGRSFEEALQKALRMIGTGAPGLSGDTLLAGCDDAGLAEALRSPTDRRVFAVYRGLLAGWSIERIGQLTGIDSWFLGKMANIAACELELKAAGKLAHGLATNGLAAHLPTASLPGKLCSSQPTASQPTASQPTVSQPGTLAADLLSRAKVLGFSDAGIAVLIGSSEAAVRSQRERLGLRPAIKRIDTMAAEYPATTNYLYMTYAARQDDIEPSNSGVMVLGSGAYRIGSSVEFDWCCVNAMRTARQAGRLGIMVNCNPETVSTDYDECDRLYFEELSLERVLDIYERERPDGLVLSMGGQAPNNLATALYDAGAVVFGTSPNSIDRAENRHKFSALLDGLGIEQPAWKELSDIPGALAFARSVGYPVLVRPSYVLSGAAMNIAWNDATLTGALNLAADVSREHPVVITKFVEGAKEIEIDAVARHGAILFHAISEHVENAGVHSGDATVVLPAQRVYVQTMRQVRTITAAVARALDITGPFNIQFLARNNRVSVIECNLRASRSFPFCSKVTGVNMIELAMRAMLDLPVERPAISAADLEWVGVKAAQFSFGRLHGADPVLGVEMASTGEVGCIGTDFEDAFLKAMLSVGYQIPAKGALLSTGPIADKLEFLEGARLLAARGLRLYASRGTAEFMAANGIQAEALHWPLDGTEPNITTLIRERRVDLVINVPKDNGETELRNDYLIRRMAIDYDIPLITNVKVARQFAESLAHAALRGIEIKAWEEYR